MGKNNTQFQIASIREFVEKAKNNKRELTKELDEIRNCIEKKDSEINSYIHIFDNLDAQILSLEERLSRKDPMPLYGVPISVKDNILIKGVQTTAASKILENYTATYDATVIERLRKAGAVFLGKVNLDEFAMGGSTETSYFGITKNPHDLARVAGGTSGGSAASVAANMAMASIGSDTGGSIRQPAAFCGVVGMKPSYGAVSRHGLIAMTSSFDQIGPLARSVEDTRLIYSVLSGKDSFDSTSVSIADSDRGNQKKLCYPKTFIEKGMDDDVFRNFNNSLSALKESGYSIEEIDFPLLEYVLSVYYIIMFAESSTNLSRFDGIRYGLPKESTNLAELYNKTRGEGFGKEVKRRILLGTYVLSHGYYDAYYRRAVSVRDSITDEFEKIFTRFDGMLLPATPSPAFKIGEKISDPLKMYLEDIFTVSANIAGIPALSVPSGVVVREGKKLPIGTQILSAFGKDHTVFDIGRDLEKTLS